MNNLIINKDNVIITDVFGRDVTIEPEEILVEVDGGPHDLQELIECYESQNMTPKMNLPIPHQVDNRDSGTTWLQTEDGYLEVDPWDLCRNVIENLNLTVHQTERYMDQINRLETDLGIEQDIKPMSSD